MSQSILNSSYRQASNLQLDKKESQMISLFAGNKVNPSLKSTLRSIKNSFGIVTCIGSEPFYVFTRQMLLHLDFSKALALTEQESDDLDYYKSEQFERDNNSIDVNSPKKIRKRPLNDDLDTSFAQVNQNEIKNILETEMYEIQSDYELSHNQLVQKELDSLQFKKTYSSVAPQLSPNFKTKSRESLQIKNQQIILNQVDLIDDSLSQNHQMYDRPSPIPKTKSVKFIDESFHNDVENFKSSMEKKKIEQIMRRKGCVKVMRNGQQKYVPKNDFIRLYNSKEIGTDKQKRPIEWIYSEVKDLTQQAIESSYLLSSTIVYELPFTKEPTAEEFEKEVKEYLQFYRKMEAEINRFDDSSSDMPEIVVVCPIDDSQKSDTVKNNFRSIFNQLEVYIIPENSKKNLNYFQSPFSQFHKSNSPSKSKLPPTPKRMMPVSHKVSQSNSTGPKKKVRLQFRLVSEELSKSGVLRQNYSRMRQITSQGREIFNEQSLKSLCGNGVSSGCYINLLERLSGQLPGIEIEEFYENWENVFEDFIKSAMEDAAEKYDQKVKELIVGKSMISQSRLMQIHEVAKKETLRQFSQKKIGSSRVLIESNKQIKSGIRLPSCESIAKSRRISISRKLVESRKDLFFGDNDWQQPQFCQQELINLVQSRIEEQKQQLAQKTKSDAIKWCRKFMSGEYEHVKRKLLSNEIKSMVNFRQQLDFLRESYKKKLENHSALEYEMMEEFTNFMMENLFGGVEVLNERERGEWREKVRREQKEGEEREVQIKQLRRSLVLKERLVSQQKAQHENKLQQLQLSIQNLSGELQLKSRQIDYLRAEHEQQLGQKQAEHSNKLQALVKQCEQLGKMNHQKSSQIVHWQSQLEKQQLLHQQTHANYEQILVTYKNNVTQLEKKVKELKETSSLAQQHIVNTAAKEQAECQFAQYKLQAESKIDSCEKELEEKAKLIHDQAHQMNQRLQESGEAIKLLQTQKEQVEVQFKLMGQKMIELESRMSRYKFNEAQLQKAQQQIQTLTQHIQSLSNQKALLEQQLTLSRQQSQSATLKTAQTHAKQLSSLTQQLADLNQINLSYRQKIYPSKSQAEVQTDHFQQIAPKPNCKNCKSNQSKLISALQIAQSLNSNYQSLKNTLLNKSCHHCHQNNLHTQNSLFHTHLHS